MSSQAFVAQHEVIHSHPRSRALAAYRLGHLTFILRNWQQLYWELTDDNWLGEETSYGVTQGIAEIKTYVVDLRQDADAKAILQMHRTLEKIEELHDEVVAAVEAGETQATTAAPGEVLWKELISLASAALEKDGSLRPFFNLGASIGELEFQAVANTDLSHELATIVASVRSMPEATMRKCESLRSVLQHRSLLEKKGPGNFLAKVSGIEQWQNVKEIDQEIIDEDGMSAWLVRWWLRGLDSRIHEDLESLGPEDIGPPGDDGSTPLEQTKIAGDRDGLKQGQEDRQPTPAVEKAYRSYEFAEQTVGQRIPDHAAYEWLETHCPTDYDLPPRPTWERYVREGRRIYGTNKNKTRATRGSRSIVTQDQL